MSKVRIPITKKNLRAVADIVIRGFAANEAYREKWESDTGWGYPTTDRELYIVYVMAGLDEQSILDGPPQQLLELARAKRLTQRGEGNERDVERTSSGLSAEDVRHLILAHLTTHHQYEGDSIGNSDPVKQSDIAKSLAIKKGRVSEGFTKLFGNAKKTGFKTYVELCRNGQRLLAKLQSLTGESPQATGNADDSIVGISGSDEALIDELDEKFGKQSS
jgi:hypothetical protein